MTITYIHIGVLDEKRQHVCTCAASVPFFIYRVYLVSRPLLWKGCFQAIRMELPLTGKALMLAGLSGTVDRKYVS